MKINFFNNNFNDECRVTLDGPDDWTRGQVLHANSQATPLRRQQRR